MSMPRARGRHRDRRRAPAAAALPQPRHQRDQVHAARRAGRAVAQPARRRRDRVHRARHRHRHLGRRPAAHLRAVLARRSRALARERSAAASGSASRSASGSRRRTAGRITVQSRLGRGTAFTVTLPARCAESATAHADDADVPRVARHQSDQLCLHRNLNPRSVPRRTAAASFDSRRGSVPSSANGRSARTCSTT